MLDPSIVGQMHYANSSSVKPFAIGDVEPDKGLIHVLDDTTLGILMRELDTAPDFVNYLTKKEEFFRSGKLAFAAGEEEILAHYLTKLNEEDEHDFIVPPNISGVFLQAGLWRDFLRNPRRVARVDANEISYAWIDLSNRSTDTLLEARHTDPRLRSASAKRPSEFLRVNAGRRGVFCPKAW